MPKDELMWKKAILAEQRALAGIMGKKEDISPLEETEGKSGGLQGCCEVMQGDEAQKLIWLLQQKKT